MPLAKNTGHNIEDCMNKKSDSAIFRNERQDILIQDLTSSFALLMGIMVGIIGAGLYWTF